MIQIIEGNVAEVKAEMTDAKKAIKSRLRGYRKTCYDRGRFIGNSEEKSTIIQLERQLELYAISRFVPMRVGNIVINYKLLESFLKKLKGLRVSLEVKDYKIVLRYGNRADRRMGTLHLYDMTDHYKQLGTIPTGEILSEDQEGEGI